MTSLRKNDKVIVTRGAKAERRGFIIRFNQSRTGQTAVIDCCDGLIPIEIEVDVRFVEIFDDRR